MGKIVVIAEKPSVARDIARVLSCGTQGKGFISGEKYIVTWAVGHLATLFEPEDYDIRFKKWRFQDLPVIPDTMNIKPVVQTAEQFETIKKLINSDEVDSLVCATDSGREGELIFRYIYLLSGCTKPFKRLWISSMTDDAIKAGFENLKDGSEYDLLFQSARCRSEADWLVGINASRAFSIMYNSNLSIGRVQTPTLGIIVSRQKEIEAFDVKNYFEVVVSYGNFNGVRFIEKNSKRDTAVLSKEEAEKIAAKVKNKIGVVSKLELEEKQVPPPLLYDLTELQRDANKKYGFSAEKTLNILQDLYEKRKAVTYPRTDSRYLSEDLLKVLPKILKRLLFNPYAEYAERIIKSEKLPISKRIVDGSKVTDHHAIIPTDANLNVSSFSDDEKLIFDLVARRFLAVFYPYYIYTLTRAIVSVDGESFISKGKTVNSLGWMELYDSNCDSTTSGKSAKKPKKNEEEQILPELEENMKVSIVNSSVVAKKTKPPALYTEATLLSAMEHAGRFVEDEDLKEHLKEGGLGTPATRAGIIERLISVGYMKRTGKSLVPTPKGIKLMDILPSELKSPETTGKWEKGLTSIYKGEMKPEFFMQSIVRYVNYLVKEASKIHKDIEFEDSNQRLKSDAFGICPICSKGGILENTKSFYCSRWRQGCRFSFWKNVFEKDYGFLIDGKIVKSLMSSGMIDIEAGRLIYKPSEGLKFIKR